MSPRNNFRTASSRLVLLAAGAWAIVAATAQYPATAQDWVAFAPEMLLLPGEESPVELEAGSPDSPRDAAASAPPPRNYYVEPRSTGTRRETEPPRYVRNIRDLEKLGAPDADWLDLGLDYRLRYEYRDDDLRRPVAGLDDPFLTRTRAYLGVRNRFDPLRGAIEFEDARRSNSQFARDDRDFNQHEIIQAYGELYFADALGDERPFRLQVGRLAFEYLDRRLIARNDWRNTTNNFQGFRAILGQQNNDWQLDLFALQPMERLLTQPDRADEQRWFYGVIGDWRRWSEIVTLQPYYLVLTQDGRGTRIDREIHNLAVRGYGIVGDTGYDYDVDVAFQFGQHGAQRHRAFGFTTDVGYTWEDRPWRPRLGVFCGYGSGDRAATAQTNERFDRLFGFARPWSANDYFLWENLLAPKIRLDLRPHEKIRVDMGYGAFWVASDTDSWANAGRHDPTGQSGDFIGQELDVRLRCNLTDRLDVIFGYAHFMPGVFTRNTGRGDDSDFFYVEMSARLF